MSVTDQSQEVVGTTETGAVYVPRPESTPTPGGLKARVRRQQREVEQRTTELFAVPLFDEILAVEMQTIAWEVTEEIAHRNERAGKNQILYSAADEIAKATVGFFEIKDTDEYEVVKDDAGNPVTSWRTVVSEIGDAKLPDGVSERVALIAMITDQGTIALNNQFRQWLGGKDSGLGIARAEVRRDF